MIQRSKKNLRTEDIVVPHVQVVENTEAIKLGVCTCLLGQRWNFACRLPGKGCNHQLISKRWGKLLKGILFLQDNSAPHTMAITHKKLADIRFEVLKYQDCSLELASLDYYLFPSLMKHLKGRKFSITEEATLAADGWFAAQQKEFFLDGLKKVEQ
jgi:hypothetical protein